MNNYEVLEGLERGLCPEPDHATYALQSTTTSTNNAGASRVSIHRPPALESGKA